MTVAMAITLLGGVFEWKSWSSSSFRRTSSSLLVMIWFCFFSPCYQSATAHDLWDAWTSQRKERAASHTLQKGRPENTETEEERTGTSVESWNTPGKLTSPSIFGATIPSTHEERAHARWY
jgi:hypothetical protein